MAVLRFTVHAVERYQKRWAPELSIPQTFAKLRQLSESAHPLKERTKFGQEQWESNDELHTKFVIKRDPSRRDPICVTVLPEQTYEGHLEYQAIYDEYMEEQAFLKTTREAAPQPQPPPPSLNQIPIADRCSRCKDFEARWYSRQCGQQWCNACYETEKKNVAHGKGRYRSLGRVHTLVHYRLSLKEKQRAAFKLKMATQNASPVRTKPNAGKRKTVTTTEDIPANVESSIRQ